MKKKSVWKRGVVIGLVLLFVLGFGGGEFLLSTQNQPIVVTETTPPKTVSPEEKKYTQEEIHSFGEGVLWPQIQELCLGRHPVPEIAENLLAIIKRLRVKYETHQIECNFIDGKPIPGQEMICMGSCKNKKGEPRIEVRVLFYLKLHDRWKAQFGDTPDLKKRFENLVTIGFMHEGFHLGLGVETCGTETGEGVDVAVEDVVWSMTCEHAILPLAQSGQPLSESDANYLNAWLPTKGQSKEWHQFIAEAYAGITKS